jgi:hypothetical protein
VSRTHKLREQVYAVIRFDPGAGEPELQFTVKEIVRTDLQAESEVQRLNALNAEKGCRYFWQETRLFPTGTSAGEGGARRRDVGTTSVGYVNRNGQTVVRATKQPGNDHLQYVYVLRCGPCGHEYGANGSDIFQRRCPVCQGGAPGLPY